MKLYHFKVFMPKLVMPTGIIKLTHSDHSMRAARNDRYGTFEVPSTIDTRMARVIEVETDDIHNVIKVVYKVKLDRDRDLSIAVLVQSGLVKSLWVNQRNDRHGTLDTSKYDRA